ncbi:hypothetical protein EJ110_NYTH47594 [Nymphaea thermarum]|nr:hypothetical protein EJ110_NYTH47594 [Nymphaea thermarum]
MSIMKYLGRLKGIVDQLGVAGYVVSDKEKVQQTLSGLGPDFYAFTTTALEVFPIMPTFNELQGKLLQHEMKVKQLMGGTNQGHRKRNGAHQEGMNRGHDEQNGKSILPTPSVTRRCQTNTTKKVLVGGDPPFGVGVQKTVEQPAELRGHPPRTAELAPVDLSVHGHEVEVVEGEVPHDQNEEYDSVGPNVDLPGVVPLLGEDLRGDVGWGATDAVEETVVADLFRDGGEAEFEEHPTLHELHDEVNLGLGGEHLEEADDVGVAQPPHDGDLPLDVGDEAAVHDPLLAHHLDAG